MEAETLDKHAFYYYKRWIWIIFPWACLSSKDSTNYSNQMEYLFSIGHGNISEQNEQLQQYNALHVALEYKYNKSKSYAKPEDLKIWLS